MERVWAVDAAERFERDGFVVSEGPVVDGAVLDDLRARLDALHRHAARLPPRHAGDLGPVHRHDGAFELSEITRAREVDRSLRQHPALRILIGLGSELVAAPVRCVYDHSIYKPPFCPHEVAWHQDAAFARLAVVEPSAHLWLALDDVEESTGGMRYWPGSHRLGPVAHRPAHPGGRGHQLRAEIEPLEVVAPTLVAGSVVAHHPFTLHGSASSTSPRPRRAWTVQLRAGRRPSAVTRLPSRVRRVASRFTVLAGG